MLTCALMIILAILIDAILGDPAYLLHPVRLIGKVIEALEGAVRRIPLSPLWQGVVFTCLILGIGEGLLILFFRLLKVIPILSGLFTLFALYSSFALRDLTRHISPIIAALEGDNLSTAQGYLQKIVGRDTTVLDRTGICRAAIETAAEGFVDGFLSPIFWFSLFALVGNALSASPCLFGAAGAFGYRIINTLDSMIGYKNEKYLLFGRFAARLDDGVNYFPARLAILFLFLAAWIRGHDAARGLESAVRYRNNAASPNAGYPESFVAGMFHIKLGGPVQYPFGRVEKPFMGDGPLTPTPETVRLVTRLMTLSGYLAAGIFAIFLVLTPFAQRITF